MRARALVYLTTAGLLAAGCEKDRTGGQPPGAARPRVTQEAPTAAACAGHAAEAAFLGGDRWRLSCLEGQPVFETERSDDAAPRRTVLTDAQWDEAWARVDASGWRGAYDCVDLDQCDAVSEPMATGEYTVAVTVPEGERRFRCTLSCGEMTQPHAQIVDAIRRAEPGQPTPFVDGPAEAEAEPARQGAPGAASKCGDGWGVELEQTGTHGAWSASVRCESGRAMRRADWDVTPDTHEWTGPDRVAAAEWDALWTAVEASDWRSFLDCTSSGGSGYERWSLVISDGAGRRTFRGAGPRHGAGEPCGSLVRAIGEHVADPRM